MKISKFKALFYLLSLGPALKTTTNTNIIIITTFSNPDNFIHYFFFMVVKKTTLMFQLVVVNSTPKSSTLDKIPSFSMEDKEKLNSFTVNSRHTYILRFGQ